MSSEGDNKNDELVEVVEVDSVEDVLQNAVQEMESIRSSSLLVNVDYLELVEYCGKEEAWNILGKLKDLLG